MGSIDYKFKSEVLNSHSDLLRRTKSSRKYDYAVAKFNEEGVLMPILTSSRSDICSTVDLLRECKEKGLEREFNECLKINDASYKRVARLRKRISTLLSLGNCIFLTLTFNDETLESTNEKERRVAVTRFLKSCNGRYVANIDYGSKNHREHYHALIQCDKINYSPWTHKYGNINGRKVRLKDDNRDSERLSKYISKLSNHAIKETTKRSVLIYSR